MQTEHETILQVIDRLSASYSRRQADDYLACFADTSMVYGTGLDETCLGADEIRLHLDRDWAQSSRASFTLKNPRVEVASGMAWAAGDCHFEFAVEEGEGSLPGRATFVLVLVDGQWRIQHAHFSAPSGTEGNSF